jgi:hypothetical protein
MTRRRNQVRVTVAKRLSPLKKQILDVQNEIRKDMIPVAASVQKSHERVVADWSSDTRPTFRVKVVVVASRIGINMTVKEANRKRPVWMWVNTTGTKRHKIPKRPKRAGVLRYRKGYRSKTKPNPARFGGAGKATGPWRSAKQVTHPGFPPRRFTEQILKDLRPSFNRAVRNGSRRGMRRALRSTRR